MNRSTGSWGAIIILVLMLIGFGWGRGRAETFDPRERFLSGPPKHSIPLFEIKVGVPRVDAIPALRNPSFTPVPEMQRLESDDRLMVVVVGDEVRGYPFRILNWHELVNDRVSGQPILITYCPLCGSGVVFDRRAGEDKPLTFGVSGLLYNSDVLFYDHRTESLWSQLKGRAVVGPKTGSELRRIPHTAMRWEQFRRRFPRGKVLSFETGYSRDYGRDPYRSYRSSGRVMFPVNHRDDRLPPKEPVVGVTLGNRSVAYLESVIQNRGLIRDRIGDVPVLILDWEGGVRVYRRPGHAGLKIRDGQLVDRDGHVWTLENDRLLDPSGTAYERVPHIDSYWFAWFTFHPDTRVFTGGG